MSPQNNRQYGPDEYPRRLRIFLDNKRQIDEHNAGNHSFQSRSRTLRPGPAGPGRRPAVSDPFAFLPPQ